MNDQRCQLDLLCVVAFFNPVVGLWLVNVAFAEHPKT